MPWRRTIKLAMPAVLTIVASSAYANAQQVGNSFFNNNSKDPQADALALFTVDGTHKIAGVIAAVYHMDPKQAPDKLIIGFYDKGEWDKFVSLWNNAVHSKPPSEADAYKINTDAPSYFDPEMHTMISVSKDTGGDIEFTLAGKPNTNGSPTVLGLIRVLPTEFKDFDADVKAVSAYFMAK
jgi:hypothetical protein